uniref:(northern house mosquito) hypothetical protein n=1 Tax=Culex pipiens TaxID=7175 RepID=A0A8D8NEB3_CULPI
MDACHRSASFADWGNSTRYSWSLALQPGTTQVMAASGVSFSCGIYRNITRRDRFFEVLDKIYADSFLSGAVLEWVCLLTQGSGGRCWGKCASAVKFLTVRIR